MCPELEDYRAHLNERHQKQSEGGRAGAAKTNKGRSGSGSTDPTGTPRVTRGSLVKQSPVQSRTAKSLQGERVDDEWVNGYERESRGH